MGLDGAAQDGEANMEYFDRVVAEAYLDRHGDLLSHAVDYRSRRDRRLPSASGRMLSRLGSWLVAMGQQLERYGQLQQRPNLTIG
jgi:hypothetical protein